MNYLEKIVQDFSACVQLTTRAFDRFGNCVFVCPKDKDIEPQCDLLRQAAADKAIAMLY